MHCWCPFWSFSHLVLVLQQKIGGNAYKSAWKTTVSQNFVNAAGHAVLEASSRDFYIEGARRLVTTPPEHHPGRGSQFCGNPNIQQEPWYTFFSPKNKRCYCDKSFSSYGILWPQLFFVYLFSSWPPRSGHPKPPKQARRIEQAVLEFITLLVLKLLAASLHSTWPGSRPGLGYSYRTRTWRDRIKLEVGSWHFWLDSVDKIRGCYLLGSTARGCCSRERPSVGFFISLSLSFLSLSPSSPSLLPLSLSPSSLSLLPLSLSFLSLSPSSLSLLPLSLSFLSLSPSSLSLSFLSVSLLPLSLSPSSLSLLPLSLSFLSLSPSSRLLNYFSLKAGRWPRAITKMRQLRMKWGSVATNKWEKKWFWVVPRDAYERHEIRSSKTEEKCDFDPSFLVSRRISPA